MGHFCKRLLYVRTYGNPVGFFLLVKSKSRTDKCGLFSFLHKLTIVKRWLLLVAFWYDLFLIL